MIHEALTLGDWLDLAERVRSRMPERRCVLCGATEGAKWIAGLDAIICQSCRDVIYEQERRAAEDAQR